MLAIKKEKRYTYQDYLTWEDDERWELLDGVAYNMTPAPAFRHQRVVGNFYTILKNRLSGKTCVVGIAPTDIVLSEHNVVQPDVFVVCDKSKITETIINGAPDLVLEVLSLWTSTKDKREKKYLYEKYGVKEYIIIDAIEQYVERFVLKEGRYEGSEVFGPQEILKLSSLEEIDIPLWEVFELEKEK